MANHPEEGKRAAKYGYKVAVPRASAQAHDKLGRLKASTPKVAGHGLSGRRENDYARARAYGFVPGEGTVEIQVDVAREAVLTEHFHPKTSLGHEPMIFRHDEGDEDESIGVTWSAAARAFADVTERFEKSEAVLAELERAVEETSR